MVIGSLRILGVLMGSHDFAMHFLDEALFQDMVHINDLPFLGGAHVALGIFLSCVDCQPSHFTQTTLPFFSFLFL